MQVVWLATVVALLSASRAPAPEVSKPVPLPAAPLKLDAKRLAYLASSDGPFPNPGQIEAPHLVLGVLEPYEDQRVVDYASALVEGDRVTDVATGDRKMLGLHETPRVWMFSDRAPCQANVGMPYAQAHDEGFVALEVGFRLEPCTDLPAPVVYLGARPPELRWEAATVELSAPIELDTWTHPARPVLESWGLSTWDRKPITIHARVSRARNAHELGFAHYWPGSGEGCGSEDETIALGLMLSSKGGYSALPGISGHFTGESLVGELLLGERTAAVVADLRYQMYVWAASSPEVWTELRTGSYHDEDVALFGWSVLDNPCEP